MKHAAYFLAVCSVLAIASRCLADGKPLSPDLSRIDDPKVWRVINAHTQTAREDGRQVLRLDPIGGNVPGQSNGGMALLAGETFDTGVVEIDLKGNPPPQQSFLGIVFNVPDDKQHDDGQQNVGQRFEAVYFRPFNFKREGFTDHAVQYVSLPDHGWKQLRETQPGKFEAKVNPVPDPAGWFHARIEITRDKVRVWVNDAKQPTLVVDRLTDHKGAAPIGLWVDSKPGAFSNLRITPASASSAETPSKK